MSSELTYDPNSSPVAGMIVQFEPTVELASGLPNTISNPDLKNVTEFPGTPIDSIRDILISSYKVANQTVVALTAQEKTDIAAAQAAALVAIQRNAASGVLNSHDALGKLIRCFADVIKDEFNILRQRDRDRSADVAAATSLADLKTRWAARSALTDRTLAQLEIAITNRLSDGTND